MPASRTIAAIPLAALLGAMPLHAELDRHPELKSRPLAWTEFDGSFLVDTGSRAEMLNFYWTVFARPYPRVNWTGSTSPANPGETSEHWRVREYAQLNAYRALNSSPGISEDPAILPSVQEGAFVLALNPQKPLTHSIDPSWNGYTATAAQTLASSLIGVISEQPMTGAADGFINDPGSENAAQVGHRTVLLKDGNVTGTLGAAFSSSLGLHFSVWNTPRQYKATPVGEFIAWPAPGHMPLGLFRSAFDPTKFRWSFAPSTDERDFDSLTNAEVTARVNGLPVPVRNLVRNFNPHPLTWEFDPVHLNFSAITEDTTVEIAVTNVRIAGTAHEYRYSVVLFDETGIKPEAFNPRSALKNISTRGKVGKGDEVLIAGFIVSGTLPVRVAVRTQGPGLASHGLTNTAGRLRIQLHDANRTKFGENAGWREHQDWRLLESFGVAPTDDSEAAMVATLWPGSYTAVVSDDEGEGVGLVEVFNIDNQTSSRLVNLSTRGFVGFDEETLIAGFIISEHPRTLVIRTQGPGLERYGINQPVSDPQLKIVAQDDGRVIAQSDDWRTDPLNSRLQTDLAVYAPTDDREAAVVLTLEPGAYTALVTPKAGAGVGIVEVFEVDAP